MQKQPHGRGPAPVWDKRRIHHLKLGGAEDDWSSAYRCTLVAQRTTVQTGNAQSANASTLPAPLHLPRYHHNRISLTG